MFKAKAMNEVDAGRDRERREERVFKAKYINIQVALFPSTSPLLPLCLSLFRRPVSLLHTPRERKRERERELVSA